MTYPGTDANAFEALAEDPPHKSPYFTLPGAVNMHVPTKPEKRTRRRFASIVAIWGPVVKMTDSSAASFLLDMLAFSDCQIDFDAMAHHWNLSSSTHLKNRLAKICDDRGFAFLIAYTPEPSGDHATVLEPESSTPNKTSKRKANNDESGRDPKRLKLIVSKKSVDVEEQRQKEMTATTSVSEVINSLDKLSQKNFEHCKRQLYT